MKILSLPLIVDHVLEVGTCISPRISVCSACSITGWKGTRICTPAITPAGTQGCVTTREQTLPYAPTTFPDGFQLPEREGRSCLTSEGLPRSAGRKQGRGQELENGTKQGANSLPLTELLHLGPRVFASV